MVRVPTASDLNIGTQRTGALQTPFQRVNADPDMFGAGLGRDIQNLGNAALGTAQETNKIQDHQAKADAYEAMNKSQERVRETHYDPENGIYSRRGEAALSSYKDSKKAIDNIYSETSNSLSDRARNKYTEMWKVKREQLLNSSARFEIQQRNAYKVESTNALINNSIDDAIMQHRDPEALADNITLIDFTIEDSVGELPEDANEDRIKRHGAIVKKKKSEARDKIYTGVITKFASEGNSDAAKKFYEEHKGEISSLNRIKIEATVKQSSLRGNSQKHFDRIASSGKSEAEQLEMARNIQDPELRDSVEARVKRSWKEPKTREQREKRAASAQAWKYVAEDQMSPESIPLEIWTSLDDSEKKAIEKYSTNGVPESSSILAYTGLKDLYTSDPKAFKEENLFNYVNDLNEEDFKYFSDRQKELISDNKAPQIQVRKYDQIAKQRLGALGIQTGTAKNVKTKDKEKTAVFFRSFNEELQLFTEENGRKPKESEVENIIDKMTEEITFDKGWFSKEKKKFKFELSGEEGLEGVEIPDEDRLEILRQVQEINPDAALTEEQIKEIYIKKISRNG